MYGTEWTENDIACLRDMREKGYTHRQIGRVLGRTDQAVRRAYAKYIRGIVWSAPPKPPKPRRKTAGYPKPLIAWAEANRDADPEARLIAGIVAEANRGMTA